MKKVEENLKQKSKNAKNGLVEKILFGAICGVAGAAIGILVGFNSGQKIAEAKKEPQWLITGYESFGAYPPKHRDGIYSFCTQSTFEAYRRSREFRKGDGFHYWADINGSENLVTDVGGISIHYMPDLAGKIDSVYIDCHNGDGISLARDKEKNIEIGFYEKIPESNKSSRGKYVIKKVGAKYEYWFENGDRLIKKFRKKFKDEILFEKILAKIDEK